MALRMRGARQSGKERSTMNFNLVSRAALAIGLITVLHGVGAGQSTFGTIVGTVHDQSGAVMPGCAITIENTGTSAQRSALTDDTGAYTVPNLEPGTYKVRIELPGFQVSEVTSVQLTARQTVRIDGTMKVATQAESVSVTAEAAP